MSTIAGFPFFAVHFDREGDLVDPSEKGHLLDALAASASSDLLVLTHGWNNDMAEATALYERLLASLRTHLDAGRAPGVSTTLPVLGVFWPSKRFASPELISGGAASFGDGVASAVTARLDDLADTLGPEADAPLRRARAAVEDLADDPDAQDAFVSALRELIPADGDEGLDGEPLPLRLSTLRGKDVLSLLSTPLVDDATRPGTGGATAIADDDAPQADAGGAASLGELFSGVSSAALRLANVTTYYLMKQRAGVVGSALAGLIDEVSGTQPTLRVHLVGHSFGGRLVTAAAAKADVPVWSLTLLQAAFSHNGFSNNFRDGQPGAFRSVVAEHRVRGPIVVTHTQNDHAVGYAYPIASRFGGQDASGLGDASDRFGGMGRNGAQHTPEAVAGRLEHPGHLYGFEPGRVYNLLADGVIADHGDVHGAHVAYVLAVLIGSTR